MKFGPLPLDQAIGKILGHNVAGRDGRRVLRKGKSLTAEDIAELRALGRSAVYVAEVEPGDINENAAARRMGEAVMGEGLRTSGPATGRVNLYATVPGVLRVDEVRLVQLNGCEGITLATLPGNTAVGPGKMVGTVKILPYALPEVTVSKAEEVAHSGSAIVLVQEIVRKKVGLILSGSPAVQEGITYGFETALRRRLEALGAVFDAVDFVALEDEGGEEALAESIRRQVVLGLELIILAGETAIMDRHDIAPRAVERAGGEVICYGAPVDPGNLLMLAQLDRIPIMGAPGCARSPKTNIVDLVLPRLLAGEMLTGVDIISLGYGGLLEDVPERPLPRSRIT